jgi:pimeloyl-ACP methyl ester carboxylesterase
MPPVLTEELAKKIPQAQFKVFPAAHPLFLEKADAINRVIVDFFREGKWDNPFGSPRLCRGTQGA